MTIKTKKKAIWMGIITLLSVTLLAACGGSSDSSSGSSTESSSATKKDTLYIGLTNAPGGFNPANSTDTSGQWILRMLYPTLLDQPESLTFKGNLADSFETTDNQTFTIKLRSGAKWSDDKPITAEDVAYSLNLIANPDVETSFGVNISSLKGVKDTGKLDDGTTEISGVKVVDDSTLTLTTKTPVDPNYLKEMTGFNIYIVPKHIVEKEDLKNLSSSTFATAPTVSGSLYKFVKYEKDSYVQLEANPSYYKGEAKLKNVYLKIVNGTSLVTELESGGVDMAAGGGIGVIPVSDIDTLKKNSNLTFKSYPGFATQFMFINNDDFDAKVRLAMTYAIDREAIVKQLFRGNAEVLPTSYTSASKYYDKDLKAIPHDVAKAKALIKESGFDTSKEIELTVPTGNKAREQSANLIQQNLEEAGFKVKQVSFDFVTALANVRSGDYQLGLIGIPMTSDPDQTYLWSKSGTTNLSRVNDSKLESLIAEGKASTNMDDRKKIYDEIQAYWQEQAYAVGLYADYQYKVQSKNLDGGIKEFWVGSLYDMQDWTKK